MRHRTEIDCRNDIKAHLCRLPNMESHEVPPKIASPSKAGLVLIPVFTSHTDSRGDFFEHHGGLSAIWARRSWLMNTDAMDYGIEVKLYIEDRLRDQEIIRSILEDNYVTDEDIIWFDGSKVEGAVPARWEAGYESRTAKKCILFGDRQLCEYDWVFQFDSDVFVIKNGETRLPFFYEFFKKAPPDRLVSSFIGSYSTTEYLVRVRDFGFEAWKSDFEALLGQDMLDRFCNPDRSYIIPHGAFLAFPAKRFMRDRWADCEKLVAVARIMICDETALSVWHAMGNEIYDICDLDNCPIVMLLAPHSADDLNRMNELSDNGMPHLFHYGANQIELYWRQGIGAL